MAYSFEQVFAADPANPANIASNAAITIYQPGDPTKTPLVITDPSGGALANPIPVNANGFGSAFMHATLDRVAWDGGGFTGFFTSYDGMKNEAVAARTAAQEAAATAGAEAAVVATAAIGDATADAAAAATDAATAASNAAASATAAANSAALVGAPADSAIAAAVNNSASATKAALNSTIATKISTDAADSGSGLRQNLSGAFASNAMFDRKRTPRPPMTVLQGMTAGHAWTVPATTGTSNLNDTADYALGDRSVTVTTPGDGNLFNLIRVTAQTLDMTGKGIVLWLKLTNAQNMRGWFIDIGDNTFTNYFRAQMNLPNGGKSPLNEGEWAPVWLPFSVFNYSKTGTPTKAGITALRMYFGDAGAGAPVTIKVGGLATYTEGVSRYPSGVASFTFDDSSAAQATYGAPYLAKYGFAGTMFPIIDRIGTTGNYSLAQLRQVVDVLGFELGAHATDTANHISVIGRTQATLETEYRAIRQWGFDNGFPSITSYAYPVGPFDKNAVQSVRKYFGYGRTNDGKNQSPTSPHRYSASAIVLGTSTTLAAAKLAVDAAIADKTWVNFVVHGLVTSAPSANDWLQSDFAALVDYCAAQGIPCAPAGDVIAVL